MTIAFNPGEISKLSLHLDLTALISQISF